MQRFLSDINHTRDNFRWNDIHDEAKLKRDTTEHNECKDMLVKVIRRAIHRCMAVGERPTRQAHLIREAMVSMSEQQLDDLEVLVCAARNPRERKVKGNYSSNVAFKLLSRTELRNSTKKSLPSTNEDGRDTDKKKSKLDRQQADVKNASAIARMLCEYINEELKDSEMTKCFEGDHRAEVKAAGPWINFFFPQPEPKIPTTEVESTGGIQHEADTSDDQRSVVSKPTEDISSKSAATPTPHHLEVSKSMFFCPRLC